MNRLSVLAAALLVATSAPALAQHEGHQMPAPAQPDPHAGHAMPAPQQPQPTPPDPHAGHAMPDPSGPPVAPAPAAAQSGPTHAADTVFDPARMTEVREAVRAEHGDGRTARFTIDRLEVALRDGANGFGWEDAQFWSGTPIDRLWLKSDGEGAFGEGLERIELQALWSHALDPWFDLQLGARADLREGPDRAHLVLGIQGLAPYWFELDAAAFLSDRGEVTARIEAEYDLRITQRLILQPSAEASFSLQDIPELAIGAGLSSIETGLRLRYEFVPEFAPYIGLEYERALGDTARFRRAAGDNAGGLALVFGIRTWF